MLGKYIFFTLSAAIRYALRGQEAELYINNETLWCVPGNAYGQRKKYVGMYYAVDILPSWCRRRQICIRWPLCDNRMMMVSKSSAAEFVGLQHRHQGAYQE